MTQDTRTNGLRQARERAGLTQSQVAAQVTLTSGAISQFESGERIPSLASAMALARVLGVSVEALFGPEGVFLDSDSTAAVKSSLAQSDASATTTGPSSAPIGGDGIPADRQPAK
jgi:transcriptional regulator with XRE-family HTH domain